MNLRFVIIVFNLLILAVQGCHSPEPGIIMTVNGPVSSDKAGFTLTHEHILVDFIGAELINSERWDRREVILKALPFLREIERFGCKTLIECTPAYIGRDPELLRMICDSMDLEIITNTGYYGASRNKYLPAHAFYESDVELANRWIDEYKYGIENTGIKPGFIKIGVDGGELSPMHRKLVSAAAKTHLSTGLKIASHTGPAVTAFEQLGILYEQGVSPEAFIWVHAQSARDSLSHVFAAQLGAWISLDGLNEENSVSYLHMLMNLRNNHLLNKVLVSHDAGWYQPGEENGGNYRGYSTIFEKLIPMMKKEGFSRKDIKQIFIKNPASAFSIKVHKTESSD
jgi:phosphotriesterase-related protein